MKRDDGSVKVSRGNVLLEEGVCVGKERLGKHE